jgi:signal transduction histidine kinase
MVWRKNLLLERLDPSSAIPPSPMPLPPPELDIGVGIPEPEVVPIDSVGAVVDGRDRPVEPRRPALSISRQLTQGMGGSLTAESEIGKGSVFTVALPRLPTETR